MPSWRLKTPDAPVRAVTLNGGARMPAWYDIAGLDRTAQEDRAGLDESRKAIETLIAGELYEEENARDLSFFFSFPLSLPFTRSSCATTAQQECPARTCLLAVSVRSHNASSSACSSFRASTHAKQHRAARWRCGRRCSASMRLVAWRASAATCP